MLSRVHQISPSRNLHVSSNIKTQQLTRAVTGYVHLSLEAKGHLQLLGKTCDLAIEDPVGELALKAQSSMNTDQCESEEQGLFLIKKQTKSSESSE